MMRMFYVAVSIGGHGHRDSASEHANSCSTVTRKCKRFREFAAANL
jgi:hypothetical protein